MSKKKPLVSVIIPVYRVESYLKESVNSIIGQTYSNLQIILVDDGSDDLCPVICDEIAKKDDRVISLHKTNGGLSDARNYGLLYAKGDYIYFFDSDDSLDSTAIESLVEKAEENKASAVVFGYRKVDESGRKLEELHFVPGKYSLSTEKEKLKFVCHTLCKYKVGWEAWNRLYKADIIKENDLRFEPNEEVFAEDLCFNLYYSLCADTIYVTNEVFYNYLIRGNSIMGKSRYVKMNETIKLMKYIECFSKQRGFSYILKHFKEICCAIIYIQLTQLDINDKDYYRKNWKYDTNEMKKLFGGAFFIQYNFIKALGLKSGISSWLRFMRFERAVKK